ncbi:hypothetical protein Sjap_012297 [Stephania japonica]|uniref:Raptor N-terminal CASPase-like domain-containing protein n=1 Tax=Stephania japonica TaxID=461633 RepID=A0AAP0NYS0_9MAGN
MFYVLLHCSLSYLNYLLACICLYVSFPSVLHIDDYNSKGAFVCFADPFSMPAPKALETIGKALLAQYERWQPRARYKHQLDPTVEEVKKLCLGCRKNAKSERVLFHYNGHGVPKPTANGEIWVFNKSYTQYIPLPINPTNSKKDQGVQESYIAAHVIKISRFLFSTKKKIRCFFSLFYNCFAVFVFESNFQVGAHRVLENVCF